MFFCKLLVVLTIITAGSSVPLTKSSSNEPERCCVAKQFSSKTTVSTGMVLPDGKIYSSYARYNFSYDENRQMVGMKGVSVNVMDGQETKLWIIENMKDGQIYTFNIDTKQCDKLVNPVPTFSCIPETAKYIDSSKYGYDDKQIIADTWLIELNGTISYSTVSRGDCVPLTGSLFIKELQIVNSLTTTDFVPRIDDPSVFDIPPECQKLL